MFVGLSACLLACTPPHSDLLMAARLRVPFAENPTLSKVPCEVRALNYMLHLLPEIQHFWFRASWFVQLYFPQAVFK